MNTQTRMAWGMIGQLPQPGVAMGLQPDQQILLAQTVGWPAKT